MTYLRPTGPIAPDALLPDDPARALALAQELLAEPKMSNHAHGLWGYSGRTERGDELTIQSIGIGGPSSVAVLAELSELGVRRAVQVGTCRAIGPGLELGDLLLVKQAISADGVSRDLAGQPVLAPDPELRAALAKAAGDEGVHEVAVASTDLLGELDGRPKAVWERRGAQAVEMASAALFAAARRYGMAVAALLAVSDAGGRAIGDEPLQEASRRMGRLAVAALSTFG